MRIYLTPVLPIGLSSATLPETRVAVTLLFGLAGGDDAGLIDADLIAAVGREGLIVNVTHGGVINEQALIAALRDGRLGHAALDVFEEEPTPPLH